MPTPVTIEELKQKLGLTPLVFEGGFFRETYRSSHSTAIYYLITPESFSALHQVSADEIFHFYHGDSVDMLQLMPDGRGRTLQLGMNVAAGEQPQLVVPAGVWQGLRLTAVGTYALLGATVAPPFKMSMFKRGDRGELQTHFPTFTNLIEKFTYAK